MSERVATPTWLLQGEIGMCPCGCIGKRRKGSFLEKTLRGATGVMQQALYNDEVATHRGLLQRLDPRVKLSTLVVLLLTTGLVRTIPVLIGLYVVAVGLAVASGLSLGFFIKRVWLFIPIFTGIIVIPAMFNVITPGAIVVPFGTVFGHEIGLTKQGLTTAGLLVLRVATSISFVVLLTLTTPWPRLLAALRALFVPRMFVLVIGMAYRYIFVLLENVSDMYTARKARSVGSPSDTRSGRVLVASAAGALFGKSHALSEEVYLAMVARGYRGDAKTLDRFQIGIAELVWVGACVGVAAVALGTDRILGG